MRNLKSKITDELKVLHRWNWANSADPDQSIQSSQFAMMFISFASFYLFGETTLFKF